VDPSEDETVMEAGLEVNAGANALNVDPSVEYE
jgi:hypothetical protein